MSEGELLDRVRALETRVRELEKGAESARLRMQDEQRHEFQQTLAGAQKTLETTIKSTVRDIAPKLERLDTIFPKLDKLDELFEMNEEQRELLRESRDERIERKLREKVALEAKQEGDRKRAEREAETQAQLLTMREKREHLIKICVAIGTVLTPLAALLATLFRK